MQKKFKRWLHRQDISTECLKANKNLLLLQPPSKLRYSAGINLLLMTKNITTWAARESNTWFLCALTILSSRFNRHLGLWDSLDRGLPWRVRGRNESLNSILKVPSINKSQHRAEVAALPSLLFFNFYPVLLVKHLKAMLETILKQENQVAFTCFWEKVKSET